MINPPRSQPLAPRRSPKIGRYDGLIPAGRRFQVNSVWLDAATTRALRHLARNEGTNPPRVMEQVLQLVARHCAYTGHCLYSVRLALENYLPKLEPYFFPIGDADQLIAADLADYLGRLHHYHWPTARVDELFREANLEHYHAAVLLLGQRKKPVVLDESDHLGSKLGRKYWRAQAKQTAPRTTRRSVVPGVKITRRRRSAAE